MQCKLKCFTKSLKIGGHCHDAMQKHTMQALQAVQCDEHGSGTEQCVDEG